MSAFRSCVVFSVFFIVLLADLPTGHGFRCWFCNSETDPRCADAFNATAAHRQEDCNPYYSGASSTSKYVCRKVKYHKQNNEVAVSRMCVLDGERENNPCSAQALSSYLRVEHCSTCETDLCNKAPALSIISSLLGPVLIIISKLKLF